MKGRVSRLNRNASQASCNHQGPVSPQEFPCERLESETHYRPSINGGGGVRSHGLPARRAGNGLGSTGTVILLFQIVLFAAQII